MTKRQEQRKAKWMLVFENEVYTLWPEHRGKIDWNDPLYLFTIDWTPFAAATHYVKAHKKE